MNVRALNKFFLHFKTISDKKAINALLRGCALPCYNYQVFYVSSEYQKFASTHPKLNQRYFRTVLGKFYIPEELYFPKATFSASPPRLTRRNLCLRDMYTCQYCGKKLQYSESTMDHVKPLSKGGKTKWDNVVLCCRPCNSWKGNKDPEELGLKVRPHVPTWNELLVNQSKLQTGGFK